MRKIADIQGVVENIHQARRATSPQQNLLVAITGIDGSGKGYVTSRIVDALRGPGSNAAGINIDGWLSLPNRRFHKSNPAQHFYLHAIRFEEMFSQLILPLRAHRTLRVEADYAEESATTYRKHIYEFHDLDVILLEGIYLLKRSFRDFYDLSFWIECGFDTALERAINRAQEGLSKEETISAYRTIYFPAQEIHFELDDPKTAATAIIDNDPIQHSARVEQKSR